MSRFITAILLSVVIVFCSCGASKEDRQNIDAAILIHNTRVHGKFVEDSLQEDSRFQIENMRIKNDPQFSLLLKRNGMSFKNDWNNPYSIEKDYALTYDKYVEYCDKNGKNVKTFYKEL